MYLGFLMSLASDKFFSVRFYLFIFRERGREGEREGEKHQCVVASQESPTGDPPRNPGMCPDRESTSNPLVHRPTLNPLSYTSQGRHIFKLLTVCSVHQSLLFY